MAASRRNDAAVLEDDMSIGAAEPEELTPANRVSPSAGHGWLLTGIMKHVPPREISGLSSRKCR